MFLQNRQGIRKRIAESIIKRQVKIFTVDVLFTLEHVYACIGSYEVTLCLQSRNYLFELVDLVVKHIMTVQTAKKFVR